MDIKESFDNSKPQVLLKCITALIDDYLAQPAHPAATQDEKSSIRKLKHGGNT